MTDDLRRERETGQSHMIAIHPPLPTWRVKVIGRDIHGCMFSVSAYFERLSDALDYIKLKGESTQLDSAQVVRNHVERQDKDVETERGLS